MTAAIDASALLAMLFAEPGAEAVADVIAEGAATSAVNFCEVATVLARHHRACLALAQRLGSPAVTAYRAWVELDLDIAVVAIDFPGPT